MPHTGSGHQSPGLWRHPQDESHRFDDVEHWVDLAKTLEAAKFHGIFIADVLGGYDVYKKSLDPAAKSGAQWPVTEPLAVIPAMAAATKNIGFGATVSTTYEQPYHLARRLSTVDHLTKGRVGWNVSFRPSSVVFASILTNMADRDELPRLGRAEHAGRHRADCRKPHQLPLYSTQTNTPSTTNATPRPRST
ncbi:LLM class flavin-dependent oxidoreductase [Candidatus Bathyarchaeota archaeon]|nr:LLM class flavin-dependent oxidoreductase [Candidatus Bathyarchaeota archaeon]